VIQSYPQRVPSIEPSSAAVGDDQTPRVVLLSSSILRGAVRSGIGSRMFGIFSIVCSITSMVAAQQPSLTHQRILLEPLRAARAPAKQGRFENLPK